AGECPGLSAAYGVPDPDLSVSAAGRDPGSVGCDRYRGYLSVVAGECPGLPAAYGVPDPDLSVSGAGRDPGSVGGDRYRSLLSPMTGKGADQPAAGPVPDPHDSVRGVGRSVRVADHDEPVSVGRDHYLGGAAEEAGTNLLAGQGPGLLTSGRVPDP